MENVAHLQPGTYILAVSGGIDSVVLLDLLAKQKELVIVVAHFDHGIRAESALDEEFVKSLAAKYGFSYETERVELGSDASEEQARNYRYAFLRNVAETYKANGIITAHHQDDVIETSMINILRGTGRSGLNSLKDSKEIVRPLLSFSKNELVSYAKKNNLIWREDATNESMKYLRNKIRKHVVYEMDDDLRNKWLQLLQQSAVHNSKIDQEIEHLLRRGLHKNKLVLSRRWFISMPHDVAKEIIRNLLIKAGAKEIDKRTIDRIAVQIKTLPHGKVLQASGVDILLTKRSARFQSRGSQARLKPL
jgi:tRNA(Ile)-lysidine synthetase-like protein